MAKRRSRVRRQFGMRVRQLRERTSLSQEDFAHAAGLGTTYVGRLERGEINVCLESIAKVARALGVGIRELFDWGDG